ncbi:MAG: hypothetical protein M1823_004948 [Watsoniomyces obsoletus]|nr:MAG: hypothetical protein M1823_004948 [Watsoniomyces obsoletus]
MAPAVEISIPTTSITSGPKPYTIYEITVRLPLRSFTVHKRFSDFLALHQSLTTQAGSAPPASLPAKSWFTRTVTSPALTEERRKSLETYLRTINESSDGRWRNTLSWRTFLSLPISSSTSSNKSSAASLGLQGTLTSPAGAGAPITDPVVWIDCHRTLKTQLHDARLHLQRRDQAQTAHEQHESSAAAKRCLVLAGGLIVALDRGLKNLGAGNKIRSDRLGEGELRRRRDLVANARKEKEALETLAHSLSTKRVEVGGLTNGSVAATTQQKSALFAVEGTNGSQQSLVAAGGAGAGGRSRRVLGVPLPETEQTRELDNRGVLQLQKQTMAKQDQSLEQMTKGVMKLKELGVAINEELEVQNSMMGLLSEDVTRYVVYFECRIDE